jgi:hypothetical protein
MKPDTVVPILLRPALPNLVAFAGYARAGKDEAASVLINAHGYARHNFSDIIKANLDPLITRHFGFSAFTEVNAEKERIRRTLEAWGDDNYDRICDNYFSSMPDKCVNTRIVRPKEAKRWQEAGGVIVRVERPFIPPATEWERLAFEELASSIQFDGVLVNDGTVEELHRATVTTVKHLGEISGRGL